MPKRIAYLCHVRVASDELRDNSSFPESYRGARRRCGSCPTDCDLRGRTTRSHVAASRRQDTFCPQRKARNRQSAIAFMSVAFNRSSHIPDRLLHRVSTADSAEEGAVITTHHTEL